MHDWHNPEHVEAPVRRVGRMVGIGRSVEAIQAEIDQCTPLCRRCHMAEDRAESRPPPQPGEMNSHAKVTWADVRAMRAAGQTQSLEMLAAHYALSRSEVQGILKNTLWKDPDYTPPSRKRRIDGRVKP